MLPGKNMKKPLYILTLIIAISSFCRIYAQDATEIIRRSEEAVRGDSQISTVEITIKTRKWTRSMELNGWEVRKGRKSFSEITSPKKDAGNRFLLIEQDMRQYVPRLKKDIKISPSMMLQSWMGSDFTNDDIIKESSITKDYYHTLGGTQTVDGHDCYRVILKPRPDADVVWGKIVIFARKSDCLPVREEFYNEHDVMKKIMTCSEFRQMDNRVIPTVYKMQTVGKEDRYTMMVIKKVRFNVNIPDYIFSLQHLKRK